MPKRLHDTTTVAITQKYGAMPKICNGHWPADQTLKNAAKKNALKTNPYVIDRRRPNKSATTPVGYSMAAAQNTRNDSTHVLTLTRHASSTPVSSSASSSTTWVT